MSNLTVAAAFTQGGGSPATGLTLSDIDLYLTQQDRFTGVDTVVWDGTQNPTVEVDNTGTYTRILTGADFQQYQYFAYAEYTGAVALDLDHVVGAFGAAGVVQFPVGAIPFTYTVNDSITGDPIPDFDVWITTDLAGSNVIWRGNTDTFGVARDVTNNLPWLSAGTYYVWKSKAGYAPDAYPDTEVVA
jgi:hypothetical protein